MDNLAPNIKVYRNLRLSFNIRAWEDTGIDRFVNIDGSSEDVRLMLQGLYNISLHYEERISPLTPVLSMIRENYRDFVENPLGDFKLLAVVLTFTL